MMLDFLLYAIEINTDGKEALCCCNHGQIFSQKLLFPLYCATVTSMDSFSSLPHNTMHTYFEKHMLFY